MRCSPACSSGAVRLFERRGMAFGPAEEQTAFDDDQRKSRDGLGLGGLIARLNQVGSDLLLPAAVNSLGSELNGVVLGSSFQRHRRYRAAFLVVRFVKLLREDLHYRTDGRGHIRRGKGGAQRPGHHIAADVHGSGHQFILTTPKVIIEGANRRATLLGDLVEAGGMVALYRQQFGGLFQQAGFGLCTFLHHHLIYVEHSI